MYNLQLQCVKQTQLHLQNLILCVMKKVSDNESLSSGPMFVEDTYDTDDDEEDGYELPHIEVAKVDAEGPGQCPPVNGVTAAPAAATSGDPDGHPMHSDCDKCKCAEDDKDNKVFFLLHI